MVERPTRYRTEGRPRDAVEREWEVFVREAEDEPMRHVGSVSAPTADVAHEQATRLFAWYATAVWVCPAEAVARYTEHTLGEDEPVRPEPGDEERTREA